MIDSKKANSVDSIKKIKSTNSNNKMKTENEAGLCHKCNSFYGNAACEGMCSKCYQDCKVAPVERKSSEQETTTERAEPLLCSDAIIEEKPATLEKKFNPRRCFTCKHKLPLGQENPCKCGPNFCSKHRLAEAHECDFDWEKRGKDILSKKLVKLENQKVISMD
jgi:hypothetical protein